MQGTAGEARTNSKQYFPICRCTSVDQPAKSYLHQLFVDTRCSLEELPEVMNDKDEWQGKDGQETPSCQCELIMIL